MHRRDFLCLRTTPSGRTLELSCRRLYMHCLNPGSHGQQEPAAAQDGDAPGMGEPPTVFTRRSPDDLLRQVEDDLRDVRVLRVLDAEWLPSTGFEPRVTAMLASFRARGGKVEFTRTS